MDLRQALAAAGIHPHGRDPRSLSDAELDAALVDLGASLAQLQRASVDPAGSLVALGAAMRAVAAHLPRGDAT